MQLKRTHAFSCVFVLFIPINGLADPIQVHSYQSTDSSSITIKNHLAKSVVLVDRDGGTSIELSPNGAIKVLCGSDHIDYVVSSESNIESVYEGTNETRGRSIGANRTNELVSTTSPDGSVWFERFYCGELITISGASHHD